MAHFIKTKKCKLVQYYYSISCRRYLHFTCFSIVFYLLQDLVQDISTLIWKDCGQIWMWVVWIPEGTNMTKMQSSYWGAHAEKHTQKLRISLDEVLPDPTRGKPKSYCRPLSITEGKARGWPWWREIGRTWLGMPETALG